MNYSPLFTLAARTEDAHTTTQDWLANEAPVLEQRLQQRVLNAAVNILEFALIVIDWTAEQVDKRHEYQLRLQLLIVLAKRFFVRQLIKVARFDNRCRFTAKAADVWGRKSVIATSAMDKVFSLN